MWHSPISCFKQQPFNGTGGRARGDYRPLNSLAYATNPLKF